ncbi:hypothetical protein NL676_028588, partial [Syzygium grande]
MPTTQRRASGGRRDAKGWRSSWTGGACGGCPREGRHLPVRLLSLSSLLAFLRCTCVVKK